MGKAITEVFNYPVCLSSFLLEGKKAPQFVMPIITSLLVEKEIVWPFHVLQTKKQYTKQPV